MGGRWGFCSGAYRLQSPNVAAETCVNLYPELPQSPGAKSPITLLHTPGLKVRYALPEVSVPGEFAINGRKFAACSHLWELTPGGAVNRGSLGSVPTGPTQMNANAEQVIILNNGNLYIFTLATNVLVAVNMAQFNGPVVQVDFCDGYFIATIQNTNTFQVSDLEDGTSWSGLFISTISYFPDNIVSMKVDHREVWFLSGKKIIAYYNSGAGFPPFIPIQGAFLEDGAGATFATVSANNTICWISANERGGGTAKMMGSYIGQTISTLAIEFAWQSYPTIADAVGYAYQDEGHEFWQIRFPTANKTWVYDFTTSQWFQKGFWNQTTASYSAHHSTSHMFDGNTHFVGDWATGNVYEMSTSIYDDFGFPLVWERAGPNISASNKWIYYDEIEFDLQKGLGPTPPLEDGNGQPRDPQVMLSWVDDLSKQSNIYILNCGQVGNTKLRVRKTMLGRARMRQFILRGSDPIPWRLCDAWLEATCEGQQIFKQFERTGAA